MPSGLMIFGGVSFPLLATADSAAAPNYSWAADPNTGMYNIGADQIGFSAGGTLRLTVSTTAVTSTVPVILPAGSAAAPSMTFVGQTDEGFYYIAAASFGLSVGGTLRVTFSTVSILSTVALLFVDNSVDIGASGATRPRNLFLGAGITTGDVNFLHSTSAALNNGAGASGGTLLNAPAAGNPTKWIPIFDGGTTRYIPAW